MLSLIEPKLLGQTKDSLINVKSYFSKFMKDIQNDLDTFAQQSEPLMIEYMQRFQDYRVKLDSKKLVKTTTGGRRAFTQFTKLRDCTTRNGELYIVEGDSAGGCLLGKTEIKLADGRNLPISELVKEDQEGKENFVYVYDHNSNSIVIEKLQTPIKSKTNTELVKVNIDNGKYIICTPDHKFMLRDGSYVEAENLNPGDSLMPLYTNVKETVRKRKSGTEFVEYYEEVLQPNGKKILTHWLSDEWNLKNNIYDNSMTPFHRHHIDTNSLNNNPFNITRLSPKDHLSFHDSLSTYKQTQEYKTYMSEKMKEQSQSLSERAKKQWEDEQYKQYMMKKWKEFYNSDEEYKNDLHTRLNKMQKEYWSSEENRLKQAETTRNYFEEHPEEVEKRRTESKEQWKDKELLEWRQQKTREQFSDPEMKRKKIESEAKNRLHKCMLKIKDLGIEDYIEFRKSQPRKYMKIETIIKKFFDNNKDNFNDALRNYNHKVISVEHLDYKDDVYDFEVPIYHNFATSAGVFIHNSIIQSRNPAIHAILPLKGKSIPNVTTRKNILQNKELGELVKAIGAGVDTHFDISKMRYEKIVCATDADHDGNHIACLVTMAIAILMPDIIKTGRYFIAQTPLFAINEKKIFIPLWSDEELEKARAAGRVISRFKGLGELSPHQLKICLLDVKTRNHVPLIYSSNMGDLEKLFSSAVEKRKLVGT